MSSATYAPSFVILVAGTELRHGATVDVLSVSVTETSDRADQFSFSVRDRHPEPARFAGSKLKWLDDGIFDPPTQVEIEMGYVGNSRKMLVGEITAMTPSFPQSGMPSLAVRGRSLCDELQRGTRRKPFKDASDSEIAEEIARDLGLAAEVDRTEAKHATVSPGGKTYDQFLRARAERIGYEMGVKYRESARKHTLFFQKPRYLVNQSAAVTLEWGRSLESFTPSLNTYDLVTEVTVRASQTSQGGGKDALVGTARAGDERAALGSTLASKLAKPKEIVVVDDSLAGQQEASEIARARLEQKSLGFITATGSSIGIPELEPRTVIEIAGLGRRFSGKYYVTSVTHTIDGNGYHSTFEVRRNAL